MVRYVAFALVVAVIATAVALRPWERGDDEGGGRPRVVPFASTFVAGPCDFELPEGQSGLAQCGTVEVPQDHTHPDEGVRLRLAVAVFRATGEHAVRDPFVYLEGGPGGNTLGASTGLFTLDAARPIQQRRDLVFIDQRGTGLSLPLPKCDPKGNSPADRAYAQMDPETLEDRAAGCREALRTSGIVTRHFNTDQMARDVVTVLRALGYTEWNIFGVSWGTRVAQTVARDEPEGLRSLILDSAVPMGWNLFEEGDLSFERSLLRLFEACRQDEQCNRDHRNLQERFFERIRALDETPENVKVTSTEGEPEELELDAATVLQALQEVLYFDDFLPDGPRVIEGIASGQWEDELVQALLFYETEEGNDDGVVFGTKMATLCQEQVPATNSERLGRAHRALGRPMEDVTVPTDYIGLRNDCASWLGRAAPDGKVRGVTSQLPALVLAGEYDPITAPKNADAIARSFKRARVLKFEASSHGVIAAGCVMETLADFLEKPLEWVAPECLAGEQQRKVEFAE